MRRNLTKGYTEEALKWSLIQQGHSMTNVTKVLEKAKEEIKEEKEKIIEKDKPKIKYELYGEDNKPIEIEVRKPFSFKKFFSDFFS